MSIPAKPIGPWLRDDLAYDPSARVRTVEVDGVIGKVTMLIVGYPMCVKLNGVHVGMADWENWAEVGEAIRAAAARSATNNEN